jgi:hypothetical protein
VETSILDTIADICHKKKLPLEQMKLIRRDPLTASVQFIEDATQFISLMQIYAWQLLLKWQMKNAD